MKKLAQKRIDMYDIGDGLTLMNVINKNEDGKMHQITTYIGIEGNRFVCVGNANELDARGYIQLPVLCQRAGSNAPISNRYF